MNYTKPEVVVLGEAVRVIEQFVKGPYTILDSPGATQKHNAAYDLDE